jgi:hypothetical protein
MKSTIATLGALACAAIITLPAPADAQYLSANVGGVGASVGAGSSYGYYDNSYSGYSNYQTYPGYNQNYYGYTNYPVQTAVRYQAPATKTRVSKKTTRRSSNYPTTTYQRNTSYNNYPAYYNTGYSYPANYYGNYNYSSPAYGYYGNSTGVSVGVGL